MKTKAANRAVKTRKENTRADRVRLSMSKHRFGRYTLACGEGGRQDDRCI
jgi:hypothetical protein